MPFVVEVRNHVGIGIYNLGRRGGTEDRTADSEHGLQSCKSSLGRVLGVIGFING